MIKAITRHQIPVFFATDDNYIPQLSVALTSLIENSSQYFDYRIFVLITELSDSSKKILTDIASKKSNIYLKFVSVVDKLDKLGHKLHLRDYYSKATYYRFFIANLFPQYDKAVYLDCDVVMCRDIAALYGINLKDNYVGAAVEEVMNEENVFGMYVEKVLGISREEYFNAGVLVLNLKKLREDDVEGQFAELLEKYTFRVTQDEDYLNIICKGKVRWINLGWNKTPYIHSKFDDEQIKLVHYKLFFKPWLYENIRYEKLFWNYAKLTEYQEYFMSLRNSYTDKDKAKDTAVYENLMRLAMFEICNNTDYYKAEVEKCLMKVGSKY